MSPSTNTPQKTTKISRNKVQLVDCILTDLNNHNSSKIIDWYNVFEHLTNLDVLNILKEMNEHKIIILDEKQGFFWKY